MVCPDTLDLGLPLPADILDQRLADFYCYAAETREIREDEDRARRSAVRRKMLRISREACPSTRSRPRRASRFPSDPLRDTAYHEAGHAIACAALGIPMTMAAVLDLRQVLIYLHPDQSNFLETDSAVGLVQAISDMTTYERAIANAFMVAAGPAAELAFGGSMDEFFATGESIEQGTDAGLMYMACRSALVHRYGSSVRFDGDVGLILNLKLHNEIWTRACRFVADDRAIRAIEAVADHLLVHSSIKGAEIVHIADLHGATAIPALDELSRMMPESLADAA